MKLRWFFVFFFLSGFCSLVYEVVWLRLAMARFGVTTLLISIFISIFMAGLGLGSWAVGGIARRLESTENFHPLRWYGVTELLIGLSAYLVPHELARSRWLMDRLAGSVSLTSNLFYLLAGLLLAATMLPWCTCMGATFPLALSAIRRFGLEKERSFSFLYLANVLGAILGALLPAFVLVELLGFRSTLHAVAVVNFVVAALALLKSSRAPGPALQPATLNYSALVPRMAGAILFVLFLTGFDSMAMEVIWIRQFTPFLSSNIYAFALILAFYLGGTYVGSQVYRRSSRADALESRSFAWLLLGLASLLPLLAADPRFSAEHIRIRFYTRLLFGIVPFTGLLGFLTPMLVDNYSGGDAQRAGKAYAINIWGCIIGPLVAGFLLLPHLGERWSLVLLALPLFSLILWFKPFAEEAASPLRWRVLLETAIAGLLLVLFTKDFEAVYPHRLVRRDYAATVIATGEDLNKNLVVNGINLTNMTPITKVMAHLPLALLDHAPRKVLVICFGMGTTHRSALSWGISSTAVELLPSVPSVYGYFHSDGPALLRKPESRLIIDDGRMFLEKTTETFDVITVDPPPPIDSAAVSLLYSQEFCEIVKRHLAPGGIFQEWLAGADGTDQQAVAMAVQRTFPYVRVFAYQNGNVHFLASMGPIPQRTAAELAARLPAAAGKDFIEWGPAPTPVEQFAALLQKEVPLSSLLAGNARQVMMTDDHPINEYWFLRQHLSPRWQNRMSALAASIAGKG